MNWSGRFYCSTIDSKWVDYLHNIDLLREGIHLRGYGQRDPLQEYKREAFEMFNQLLRSIQQESISMIFRAQPMFAPSSAGDGPAASSEDDLEEQEEQERQREQDEQERLKEQEDQERLKEQEDQERQREQDERERLREQEEQERQREQEQQQEPQDRHGNPDIDAQIGEVIKKVQR